MSMTGRMTAVAMLAATLIGSLAFFLAAMGLCIGLVLANAAVSPQVVWFPLPLLALPGNFPLLSSRDLPCRRPG